MPQTAAVERNPISAVSAQTNGMSGSGIESPWIAVDISPEAWAAYARGDSAGQQAGASPALTAPSADPGMNGGVEEAGAIEKMAAMKECKTCKSRTYQDQSDDPSVSFQTPTHISPEQSASTVLSHEYEHVSNEQAKADREGRRVISQTVSLQSAICPECGKVYVSGGTTRTVTAEEGKKTPEQDMVEKLL